jgi:ribosomal protein L34E
MARRQKTVKTPKPKTVLRLPDLEQSKNRGAEFSRCGNFQGILTSRNRRVHRLVARVIGTPL